MQIIRDILGQVRVGEPATFANLTLFPLLMDEVKGVEYATLDQAIEQGWLEVSEISAAGSVPELKVVNKGATAVFMLDGEEVLGAKQNRVLNLTILVPAGRTLVVPVSCVEQRRWATQSVRMSSSGDALYARARMAKLKAVSGSYASSRRPTSDQGALWRAISRKAASMGVGSPTGAMSDIFEQYQKGVTDYEAAFHAAAGQYGAIFAIGERPVGVELFGHPSLLGKLLRKIVRSYALDAIEVRGAHGLPTAEAARDLLADVAEGHAEKFPAVGLGEDLRIRGRSTTGAALVVDGRVAHLCAFRNDGEQENDPGLRRAPRASPRRG